ncbi:MAG: CHC2 zinc finger domain-containing protein, partial [Flavobacteriales bacterium]
MTIQDIKTGLDITDLADHLGIPIDKKSKKGKCPFHNDKTPSLQFSSEKQICTCFSSACNAGTMDVISLTEKKLNLSTHQAINYIKKHFFFSGEKKESSVQLNAQATEPLPDYNADFEVMHDDFLKSLKAKEYLDNRGINWRKQNGTRPVQVGFNSYKLPKFNYLRGCVIFPLKDQEGNIVSMYGRSIQPNTTNKHYYTKGAKGFYPSYPKPDTKRIILTESIIDAATLLSLEEPLGSFKVLSLYGSNVFRDEYKECLVQLEQLEEICLFLDGDAAGRAAVEKYSKML